MHKTGAPVFALGGKNDDLGNKEGYRQFWAIYHRPPKSEYRVDLVHVAAILGHKSVSTTKRLVAQDPVRLADIVAKAI
jgi:hypothetical protein